MKQQGPTAVADQQELDEQVILAALHHFVFGTNANPSVLANVAVLEFSHAVKNPILPQKRFLSNR